MDNYCSIMNQFIQAVAEYSRTNSDSRAVEIQTHLLMLSTTTDGAAFDTRSEVPTQFIISLHQLMSRLDVNSTPMLVSHALAVLQKAGTNKATLNALIHTYKFIPVLSRFLNKSHPDVQLRLLQVLSNLTYGVKIMWQEAHLPELISNLELIIIGNKVEHKAEALSVLVNLCHNNLPVLYVLMRRVQVKKLLKCVLAMNDSPSTRMLVCKLLFIISEIKGPLADEEILNFVDGTFTCVAVSYQERNAKTLQHVTDFFKEINDHEQIKSVISRYPKVNGDAKMLLDLVENAIIDDVSVENCLSILLNFLPTVFNIKITKTRSLLPRCVELVTQWLGKESTLRAAVNVLMMATELSTEGGESQEITTALSLVLEMLCKELLVAEVIDHTENKLENVSAIVALIVAMANCTDLRKQIIRTVDPLVIKALFTRLYESEVVHSTNKDQLTVVLLLLVETVSTFAEDWMVLYLELLSQRPIISSVAAIMVTGDSTMKQKVFRLVRSTGWDRCLTFFCNELTTKTQKTDPSQILTPSMATFNSTPSGFVSESGIDEILQRFNGVTMADASLSAIMELYEYKIATLKFGEERTQEALQAADSRCIGLNHQVAQLKLESEKLRKLLLYQQRALEGSSAERKDFLLQINRLDTKIHDLEGNLTEKNAQLNTKETRIIEMKNNLEEIQSELLTRNRECEETKEKLSNLSSAYSETQAEKELCMTKLSQKDEEIADYKNKVRYLEQIREAVISVAARKEF